VTDDLEIIVLIDAEEVSLDLGDTDDFPLALTFQVAEIKANIANDKRIDDRKSSFSKTFEIPATKKNCTALNHIWNVNILDTEVEALKNKLEARLQDSTGTLLDGFIQVDSVTHLRGEVNKFDLIFFSDNFSWIDELGNLKLSDLPIDSIPFEAAAMEDSWDLTADDIDYIFPLVNYGAWLHNYVTASDMYPALYIRNVFQKAFAYFGYTIESLFFESAFFKKLILLANKTKTDVPDISFEAIGNASSKFIFTNHPDDSYTIVNIDRTTELEGVTLYPCLSVLIADNSDTNGHGFIAGEQITITGNAEPDYNGTFVIQKIKEDTPGSYLSHTFLIDPGAIPDHGHTNLGGTVTRTAAVIRTTDHTIEFPSEISDPSNVYANPSYTVSYAHAELIQAEIDTLGCRGNTASSVEFVIQKNAADEGTVDAFLKDKLGAMNPTTEFDDNVSSVIPLGTVVIGDVYNVIIRDVSAGGGLFSCGIEMSKIISFGNIFQNAFISEILLPFEFQDLTIIDLFKDVVILFNLFVKTDILNKKVTIEPRDDFYKSTSNAVNWSEYLEDGSRNPDGAPIDETKEFKIEFLKDMAIEQLLRYKEDSKDGYVKEIEKALPLPILSHLETLTARFKKGREEISTKKLSPSWYIYDEDISPTTGGLLMPRLWKDYADDSTPPDPLVEFAPRILYYKGNTNENNADGNAPQWRWISVGNVLNEYPKAFDINWDVPGDESLSFEDENSSEGLFTKYWKNYFELIKDGVFVTCYLKLNNNHIRNLDLQKPIYLDGTYYIINKISDYKPLKDESTKVELVKIG